ncbi:hypothetical protein UC34_16765 [Pandoraea vervacti]|uniref:Uncharacterized protein n=2 Tax=Pandoraea vervacti TaxID=656178 RepID=A0ABM5T021_9BURK|nr:hypothetical protein UC34_16765 [Pandoraea vervacti]
MPATAMSPSALREDVASIATRVDTIDARLDDLPRDIFSSLALPHDMRPRDIPVGVVLDEGKTDREADPGRRQYRVIGSVGQIVADRLMGAGNRPWPNGNDGNNDNPWICPTPHQDPAMFALARPLIDAALAWARTGLPEDHGRETAKSLAEAILEQPDMLQTIAAWNAEVLATRIAKEIDTTLPAKRLIANLMRAVCEHPTAQGRVDHRGNKLLAYTVEIGVCLDGTQRIDRLTVPGMVLVSTAVMGADDRNRKSAVLYCAGMQDSFKARAFGSMEKSLAEFEKRAQAASLLTFPDSTSSLEEILPFYLRLMVPDFSHATDQVAYANLVAHDGDIFQAMGCAAAITIGRGAMASAPRDFASESVLRRLWREWLGGAHVDERPPAGTEARVVDASREPAGNVGLRA